MKLTDNEKAALRRDRPGHHRFTCCRFCGAPELRSINPSEPDGVSMEETDQHCRKCTEVSLRSPEIAEWVIAIVGYQFRKREP